MNDRGSDGSRNMPATSGIKKLGLVLWILPLLVALWLGMVAAERFIDRGKPRPHPITSRRGGGGLNPLWCTHSGRLIYEPCLWEDNPSVLSGIYAMPRGQGTPELVWDNHRRFLTPMSCDPVTGLIFALDDEPQVPVLYQIDPVSRDTRKIREGVYGISVSSQNQVAVIMRSEGGAKNIALYDIQSNSMLQLTHYTHPRDCVDYSLPIEWTWDGNTIVFRHSQRDKTKDFLPNVLSSSLLSLDIRTGKTKRLPVPDDILGFAMSPVDDRIAYGIDDGLYVKGWHSKPRRIADNYGRGGWRSIAWSPDGMCIAYDGSDKNLWIVPANVSDK